jgi:hypothetical protein
MGKKNLKILEIFSFEESGNEETGINILFVSQNPFFVHT